MWNWEKTILTDWYCNNILSIPIMIDRQYLSVLTNGLGVDIECIDPNILWQEAGLPVTSEWKSSPSDDIDVCVMLSTYPRDSERKYTTGFLRPEHIPTHLQPITLEDSIQYEQCLITHPQNIWRPALCNLLLVAKSR